MPEETSPERTDFPITLGGKEYTLAFPITAIWALEDATGRKFLDETRSKEEIMVEYEHMSKRKQLEEVVAMLYAGLITHHPDMTKGKAGSFVFLKNLVAIQAKVVEAFNASMSNGEKLPEAEGEGPLEIRPN